MFFDLIEAFLAFKVSNRGRSSRTADIYRLALHRLAEFFDGRDPLEASDDELLTFTGPWLHKRGLIAESRRPYVAAVREFYRWAKEQKHVKGNPAAGIPYPNAGRKLPKVMTLANAERLLWGPDFSTFEGVRDGAMLSVLLGCGLRASGIVRLNEGDVISDQVDGKIRLALKIVEKGGKERRVPVPPEADLLLRLYLEHPDLQQIDRALKGGDKVLFISLMNRTCPPHEYHGERRRMNRRAVLEMVKRYGRRAGIPEGQIHPHAMRHLFGTELAESDVDLLTRQKLMGHADPKSTEIYTHTAMRKLAREADRGNPLAKINTPVSELLRKLAGAKP